MISLNSPRLMLCGVKDISSLCILEKHPNFQILRDGRKHYLIVKRKFQNAAKQKLDSFYIDKIAKIETIALNLENAVLFGGIYGSKNDFIIDMNGIDNFRFAKSQYFCDSAIRTIVKKMKWLSPNAVYLRFGASGTDSNAKHHGGEVFEYQFIDGNTCGGMAQSVSGYLDNEYSKSIPLSYDKKVLRDDRTVYSHTAWLEQNDIQNVTSYYLKIECLQTRQSVLDIISTIAKRLEINSYAVQLYIKNREFTCDSKALIKGRVLKRVPTQPFSKLQDATDIAIEKTFELPEEAELIAVGTRYNRYEPDWEKFTNGHKYETRGHFHATIVKKEKYEAKIHETFHLRDVWIEQGADVRIMLTPIDTVYRIYPIHMENKRWLCNSNNVDIKILIESIANYDAKPI